MKEDVDKIIEDALGVMQEPKEMVVKEKAPPVAIPEGDDVDVDYEYQRQNLSLQKNQIIQEHMKSLGI